DVCIVFPGATFYIPTVNLNDMKRVCTPSFGVEKFIKSLGDDVGFDKRLLLATESACRHLSIKRLRQCVFPSWLPLPGRGDYLRKGKMINPELQGVLRCSMADDHNLFAVII